jgi:hypothetical protein
VTRSRKIWSNLSNETTASRISSLSRWCSRWTKYDNTGSRRLWTPKEKSPTYSTYIERYGTTDELEALAPSDLATILDCAINQELDAEKADCAHIVAVKEQAKAYLKKLILPVGIDRNSNMYEFYSDWSRVSVLIGEIQSRGKSRRRY